MEAVRPDLRARDHVVLCVRGDPSDRMLGVVETLETVDDDTVCAFRAYETPADAPALSLRLVDFDTMRDDAAGVLYDWVWSAEALYNGLIDAQVDMAFRGVPDDDPEAAELARDLAQAARAMTRIRLRGDAAFEALPSPAQTARVEMQVAALYERLLARLRAAREEQLAYRALLILEDAVRA